MRRRPRRLLFVTLELVFPTKVCVTRNYPHGTNGHLDLIKIFDRFHRWEYTYTVVIHVLLILPFAVLNPSLAHTKASGDRSNWRGSDLTNYQQGPE
jgi:hypothetical protein